MGTRYDCRNDPAWHVKNKQTFVLGPIVTNGPEKRQVASLEELQILDANGQLVTQERVQHHLEFMNGEKLIGNVFSAQTSMNRVNQNQRGITKSLERDFEASGQRPTQQELRERRKIMDSFDKQMLQVKILDLDFIENFKFLKLNFRFR